MADIKTRDIVKGTIKTLDKSAIAADRMRSAYAKTKERARKKLSMLLRTMPTNTLPTELSPPLTEQLTRWSIRRTSKVAKA